ncbi:MAG: hypothetical protein ACHRXM_36185 [Isosphaerales bacterium]
MAPEVPTVPQAAEHALREIPALDPVNAEARYNLAFLLSKPPE